MREGSALVYLMSAGLSNGCGRLSGLDELEVTVAALSNGRISFSPLSGNGLIVGLKAEK